MRTSGARGWTRGRAGARHAAAIALAAALLAALLIVLRPNDEGSQRLISGTGDTTTTSLVMADPVLGAPRAIALHAARANGRTRIEESLRCDGADGVAGYWHLQGEDALAPGTLTAPTNPLTGDLRLLADVHSPHHTIRTSPEPLAAPGPLTDSAYLLPDASRVALSNARGTVKLALASGGCTRDGLTLDFDGSRAVGGGTWQVESSTGSYRSAAGSGSFDLDASVLPGADNPWTLDLRGALQVLQPQLRADIVETYWGRDGVDYLKRQVAAVYRITNIGAGDSFGTALTAAASPTPGASLIRVVVNGENLLIDGNPPVGTFPRSLGDLASGEDILVTVVWQLPLPAGNPPCRLVILGCEIQTTLTMSAPDALDLPTTQTATVAVKAPDLPPPT